jgi:hypothetical protein
MDLQEKQSWVMSLPNKFGMGNWFNELELVEYWFEATAADLSALTGIDYGMPVTNVEQAHAASSDLGPYKDASTSAREVADELNLPWTIEDHNYDGLILVDREVSSIADQMDS